MMRETAKRYLDAGLCALPAMRKQKRPAVGSWKDYQNKLPDEDTFDKWFKRKHDAVCVLTGKSSGNLELIDFDQGGELFGPWSDKIPLELLDRLVIETSQSGGRHVVYRCANAINNSMKLARRAGDDGGPITLIETRGNGGLFLCAPTAGYEPVQGDLTNLPLLTAKERELLLQAAWEFNKYPTSSANCSKTSDDVGQTGELSADNGGLCEDNSHKSDCSSDNANNSKSSADNSNKCDCSSDNPHNLPMSADNSNIGDYSSDNGHGPSVDVTERARLYLDAVPGAISGQGGHSQTFVAAQALVNGFCLEPDEALRLLQERYNPRCKPPWTEKELLHKVNSALEHPSDKPRGWLRDEGFEVPEGLEKVDVSGIIANIDEEAICDEETAKSEITDPGHVPNSLLYIPGFVGEIIDFGMAYAPYPSLGMNFCGAVSIQSHLCGRKVREEGDLRTNLYLLALAHSSAGKNYPREINAHLSTAAGMAETLGTKFSSGEAIEDKLEAHPCMLFQTDEIDGILQSVAKARDARHESTISTLLTMFSSANMMYPKRAKAGNQGGSIIHQPHLSVFGTATPTHFYEALTERMLTNGFFARMTIIDTGKRAPGQDTRPSDTLPERLIEIARWWGNFQPGEHRGNLIGFFPKPIIVPYSEDGRNSARDFRAFADSEYSKAEDRNDEVAMTVWGRANENARKLALIYACSENHKDPQITLPAMRWAEAFVEHQVKRMLYMASQYVCRDDFDGHCKSAIRVLRDWHARKGANTVLPRWQFRRKLKLHPSVFKDVTFELIERRQIMLDIQPSKTKPKQGYRLL